MLKKQFIGIFIEPETLSDLALVSETLGLSRSAVVRDALKEYLEVYQGQPRPLARRLANKLEAQWRQEVGDTDSDDEFEKFCEGMAEKLTLKRISPETVEEVIKGIRLVRGLLA